MSKNIIEDQEEDLEVGEVVAKKREKKKKSKEEKQKDRRVVFWVMVSVLIATLVFWLKAFFEGRVNTGVMDTYETKEGVQKNDTEDRSRKGFFVRYEI